MRLVFHDRKCKLALFCFKKVFRIIIRNRKQNRRFLVHNDLFNYHNARYSSDGKLGLIDFGQARIDRRWVMLDVVDICLTYDMKCRRGLYSALIQDIRREFDVNKFNERDQVWVAVFRQVGLRRPCAPFWHTQFLTEILAVDKEFEAWFQENFGT